jgi:hypothetical protein
MRLGLNADRHVGYTAGRTHSSRSQIAQGRNCRQKLQLLSRASSLIFLKTDCAGGFSVDVQKMQANRMRNHLGGRLHT